MTLLCSVLFWLGAGTLWLAALSIHWPLIHDAPLLHYIAWRIGQGAVPYRDMFDMNLPRAYILHLAALRVFGASDAGWRLFDALWLILTGTLLWRFCLPYGNLNAGVAALRSHQHGPTGLSGVHTTPGRLPLSGPGLRERSWEPQLTILFWPTAGYAMSIKPLAIILLFAPAGMAFPARTRT